MSLAISAAVSDLRHGEIVNILTFAGIFLGLFLGALGPDLLSNILGFLVAIIPAYLLYTTRTIGGGDVKLFAALGTLVGYPIILDIFIISILLGAIHGFIKIVAEGGQLDVLHKFGSFFFHPNQNIAKEFRATVLKIPFAVSIAVATFWVFYFPDFRLNP